MNDFASQDGYVKREAASFWQANSIGRLRAKALEEVYADWDQERIQSWDDVDRYIHDFSDSSEGGVVEEGEECFARQGWKRHAHVAHQRVGILLVKTRVMRDSFY